MGIECIKESMGKIIIIIGNCGSGKTTLARVIVDAGRPFEEHLDSIWSAIEARMNDQG